MIMICQYICCVSYFTRCYTLHCKLCYNNTVTVHNVLCFYAFVEGKPPVFVCMLYVYHCVTTYLCKQPLVLAVVLFTMPAAARTRELTSSFSEPVPHFKNFCWKLLVAGDGLTIGFCRISALSVDSDFDHDPTWIITTWTKVLSMAIGSAWHLFSFRR